jgi:hypothetical protein
MISTKKQFHPLGENQRQPSPSLTNQTLCVLSALMVLILVGLLPTTANAGSVVNECKTGAECAYNALAFFIRKSKLRATTAII